MTTTRKRRQILTPEQRAEHDQQSVDGWNARFPVGTTVWYWHSLPFGPVTETTVRADAFIAYSGEPVCFLKGISGYVSVFHVFPPDEARREHLKPRQLTQG